MESYKSNCHKCKSLLTTIVALSAASFFISSISLSAQERVDIDTLQYRYHNPEQDNYSDMLSKDKYGMSQMKDSIVVKDLTCPYCNNNNPAFSF